MLVRPRPDLLHGHSAIASPCKPRNLVRRQNYNSPLKPAGRSDCMRGRAASSSVNVTMPRIDRYWLNLVLGTAIHAAAGIALAAEPANATPRVVLEAAAETERAPHGEGNVYAPCLLQEGSLLRMWYGGQGRDGHDRIHYAESRDGLNWTRHGVVLRDASANHVNDPSVVKVGDRYYMYYTRTERDVVDRIDLAVSQDGKTWEPRGVALAPAAPEAWDGLSVGRPAVLQEDGRFWMWYDGRRDFPPGAPVTNVPKSESSRRSVGLATSEDGLQWIRSSEGPVHGNDVGAVDVKRVSDKLLMVYESREGTRSLTSHDGIRWSDDRLLVAKSGEDVDAFGHVTPCLVKADTPGSWRLLVGAARATTWDRNRIAVLTLGERLLLALEAPAK